HRDRAGAAVRHGQVGLAVAVQVPDRDRGGVGPGREVGLGSEAAGAVAEQHRDRAGAEVRHHQVWLAVTVHVPAPDRAWTGPDRSRGRAGPGTEVALGPALPGALPI